MTERRIHKSSAPLARKGDRLRMGELKGGSWYEVVRFEGNWIICRLLAEQYQAKA